jgi:hypothetical protein
MVNFLFYCDLLDCYLKVKNGEIFNIIDILSFRIHTVNVRVILFKNENNNNIYMKLYLI